MLSLDCMINAARPSATQGRISLGLTSRFSRFRRSSVFLPRRKQMTHTQDSPWLITVASAAPRTPMPSP